MIKTFDDTIQEVKGLYELTKKSVFDLTFDEFKSVINFDSYNLMIEVLDGTSYPAKNDYSHMTPYQAKAIQLIEQMMEARDETRNKISIIAKELLKSYALKTYPEQAHMLDWVGLNWSDLQMVYNALHNQFE